MRSRLRRQLGADDGFTLVELVMTVAIVGIIVVPLTGVVLSYLRNTVDTQARLSESHDVQFASAYWQRDVASIGVRSSTYDTTTHSFPLLQSVGVPPCGLPAGTSAVATLAWSHYNSLTSSDAPATVTVTYASRSVGGAYELVRVRCLDGSPESTVEVADSLLAPPALVCLQPDGGTTCTAGGAGVPAVVKLLLEVHDSSGHNTDAYTATLSGERRQT